ncbi:hypothetical protein BDA96_01G126300 [Sorghum bicolor]|uniref:Chromo domain-containing protein n=1 Tax=Sorghum bicolor TaxID=4558 RepID=A0A921RXG6_SORBI|nr:hypothetical protein BDA96_01G126300 [Sorghum bicolor]
MCKVLWSNHTEREATWEKESELQLRYPYLFERYPPRHTSREERSREETRTARRSRSGAGAEEATPPPSSPTSRRVPRHCELTSTRPQLTAAPPSFAPATAGKPQHRLALATEHSRHDRRAYAPKAPPFTPSRVRRTPAHARVHAAHTQARGNKSRPCGVATSLEPKHCSRPPWARPARTLATARNPPGERPSRHLEHLSHPPCVHRSATPPVRAA